MLIFVCCFSVNSNFIVTTNKFTQEQMVIEMSMIKYTAENPECFKLIPSNLS